MSERTTHLLVDGENIDATLGGSVLGRRPQPEERPRWNKLLEHAQEIWGQPVNALFFLAANDGMPMPFVQALLALGYRVVPLQGEGKIVDIAIQRTLEALWDRPADAILVSHDADFVPQMTALAADPHRRTAAIGFQEFTAAALRTVPGIELYDLEYDVAAFTKALPRVRVIDIDAFDPLEFI
ncbi:NYN domain-containing protein [Citricoccus sp. SGAir0253]|uniref:NYN domain-containing protein n=1 Tax=Citricoccus sp. SGAir0253 TaxID=2567881 RepID=UPI0010CCB735|nr:NYN domain-containing protein [Citricoccus sp. SGAir0253]QCU77631.1 NYN domain-containing protein [Citricoccus sp. SGAir0253]